jgi:hypothetical protein
MNVPAPTATGVAVSAPTGIPAQRSSDAFTAYASVHELGIAQQRAASAEGEDLNPTR